MSPEQFSQLVSTVTAVASGRVVDKSLEKDLNARFPADGPVVAAIKSAIELGVAEGWMCGREHGGIKYGRVAKPGPELHGCSIDVVDMTNLAGPHHIHPKGEIDLILPMEGDAKFDGHGAGWLVYGPGSGHRPTVSEGRAYVLYLLPDGAIEFSK